MFSGKYYYKPVEQLFALTKTCKENLMKSVSVSIQPYIGVNPGVDGVVATTLDFRVGWSCGMVFKGVMGCEILSYPNYIL